MSELYLLCDQNDHFLTKEGQWLPLEEARSHTSSLFRTAHKDEAINQKVETIVKNPELRIALKSVPIDAKGLPQLIIEEALI